MTLILLLYTHSYCNCCWCHYRSNSINSYRLGRLQVSIRITRTRFVSDGSIHRLNQIVWWQATRLSTRYLPVSRTHTYTHVQDRLQEEGRGGEQEWTTPTDLGSSGGLIDNGDLTGIHGSRVCDWPKHTVIRSVWTGKGHLSVCTMK